MPSKRSIQPQPVKDIQYNKREYDKNVKAGTSSQKKAYDPRHTCDRTLDREQMDTLVSRIVAACPASGMKHFWVDRADFVEGAMPESLSVSQTLEPLIIYQVSKPSCLPDTVVDITDIDPGCTVFKELCYLYEEQQVLSEELYNQIEMLTVTHRQCDLWHDLHNGRITSSKFGQIVHRRETTDTRSIVGQLMGYDPGVLEIKFLSLYMVRVCVPCPPLTLQKDTLHSTLTEMATLKKSITITIKCKARW